MPEIGTAFILAGGMGERLRPLTYETPKPLLPIQGKTILEHQFDLLQRNGIGRAIISVGYLREKIRRHVGNGKKFGIEIKYIEETEPLGTAGPLNKARKLLAEEEDFLCFNADNLMRLDIPKMLEQHSRSKATATIALVKVENPSAYGIARLSGNRILEFVEKPSAEQAPGNNASSGFYIFNSKLLEFVPRQEGKCMLEKSVFPKIAESKRLCAFQHNGQWFDIGTIENYVRAKNEWKGNK